MSVEGGVEQCEDVVGVDRAEAALDRRPVRPAVAGRAARVAVDDRVAGLGEHLHLVEERVRVLGVRSAVDHEDRRVRAVAVPPGVGRDDPPVHRVAVRRGRGRARAGCAAGRWPAGRPRGPSAGWCCPSRGRPRARRPTSRVAAAVTTTLRAVRRGVHTGHDGGCVHQHAARVLLTRRDVGRQREEHDGAAALVGDEHLVPGDGQQAGHEVDGVHVGPAARRPGAGRPRRRTASASADADAARSSENRPVCAATNSRPGGALVARRAATASGRRRTGAPCRPTGWRRRTRR